MKSCTFHLALAFLLVTALCSCYPTIHFPDRINSSGFREKGEAKLTAAVKFQPSDGSSANPFAPAADAGYSVTKHIGIIASYRSLLSKHLSENSVYGRKLTDTSFGGTYNGNYWEAGGGYYKTVGRVGQIEIYGGAGIGNIQRSGYVNPQYDFNSKYYKVFLQPAFSISPDAGKFFRVGAGFRIAMIDYYTFTAANPDMKYIVTNSDPHSSFKKEITSSPYAYFEPFINMEAGYKFIKFNIQLGASGGISDWSKDLGESPYLSFGLVFHYAPGFFR